LNRWFFFFILLAICLLFISCPNPIKESHFLQVKDSSDPVITIITPENGSSYASVVLVEGTVTDTAAEEGSTGRIDSLTYEVLATSRGGSVEAADGKFSFYFETSGLSGSITLELSAVDWNGNAGKASLTLVDAGAIPSFSAEPGNGKVALSWDYVPLTESYTVHYTENGSYPSESYGKHITRAESPLVISELQNNARHVFMLQAVSSVGEDSWSDYITVIPSSPLTLAPKLTPFAGKVVVEWNEVDTFPEFEVMRKAAGDSSYDNISGVVYSPWYEDESVDPNTLYYYKVRPAYTEGNESLANAVWTSPFPLRDEELITAIKPGKTYGQSIGLYGDHLCTSTSTDHSAVDLYNISDPLNVQKTSVMPFSAKGFTLADREGKVYGYFAAHHIDGSPDNKFIIYDVTSYTNPVWINEGNTPVLSDPRHASVSGDYAFVSDGTAGLKIYNISNAANPVQAGSDYTEAGEVVFSAVRNNTAYLCGPGGLTVINVSDPESGIPVPLYQWTGAGSSKACYVCFKDNVIYCALDDAGFAVFTETLPGTLTYQKTITSVDIGETPPGTAVWKVRSVNTEGDLLATAGENYGTYLYGGVHLFNISDPVSPLWIRSVDTGNKNMQAFLRKEDNGTVCAYAISQYRMNVYNMSCPELAKVCHVHPLSNAGYLGINGNTAGLGTGCYDDNYSGTIGDFYCFDLTVPGSPVLAGHDSRENTEHKMDANGFDMTGNYAVVANGNEWDCPLYNMSIDASPPAYTGCNLPGGHIGNRSVAVCGDYAYRLTYYGSTTGYYLDFFNISNFGNISNVNSYILGGSTVYEGLEVLTRSDEAQYLFIPSAGGLIILDISRHEYPSVVPSGVSVDVRDVAFGELSNGTKLAFLAVTAGGIRILDISGLPGTPVDAYGSGTYGTFPANSVDVAGDYLYAASLGSGVTVVDVSDPANPSVVKTIDTNGSARDVSVQGRYLYVADDNNGLTVIDLLP